MSAQFSRVSRTKVALIGAMVLVSGVAGFFLGSGAGIREGYKSGYDAGYEMGFEEGREGGLADGKNFGQDKGRYQGYVAGYQDGWRKACNEYADAKGDPQQAFQISMKSLCLFGTPADVVIRLLLLDLDVQWPNW